METKGSWDGVGFRDVPQSGIYEGLVETKCPKTGGAVMCHSVASMGNVETNPLKLAGCFPDMAWEDW